MKIWPLALLCLFLLSEFSSALRFNRWKHGKGQWLFKREFTFPWQRKRNVLIKWITKAKYLLLPYRSQLSKSDDLGLEALFTPPRFLRKPKVSSVQLKTGLAQDTANGTGEAVKTWMVWLKLIQLLCRTAE